jgi:hypothetical protein
VSWQIKEVIAAVYPTMEDASPIALGRSFTKTLMATEYGNPGTLMKMEKLRNAKWKQLAISGLPLTALR